MTEPQAQARSLRESPGESPGLRERALLGIVTFHIGESRASPAHGLCITILTGLLDSLASIWPRLCTDSDEGLHVRLATGVQPTSTARLEERERQTEREREREREREEKFIDNQEVCVRNRLCVDHGARLLFMNGKAGNEQPRPIRCLAHCRLARTSGGRRGHATLCEPIAHVTTRMCHCCRQRASVVRRRLRDERGGEKSEKSVRK